MPKRERFTVTPDRGGNGWTLTGGASEESFSTKAEAVQRGAQLGRQRGNAQLVIKGRNGRIQSERTYGNDPRRTKG